MALVGVGVLGINYAALSLALRLPGIRSFRQSIIAIGSRPVVLRRGRLARTMMLFGLSEQRHQRHDVKIAESLVREAP